MPAVPRTPTRSKTVFSYWALVSRGSWEVRGTPGTQTLGSVPGPAPGPPGPAPAIDGPPERAPSISAVQASASRAKKAPPSTVSQGQRQPVLGVRVVSTINAERDDP